MEVKKKKNLVLCSLGFIAFLSGMADQYFSLTTMYPFFNPLVMIGAGILSFIWYRYDTNEIFYQRKPLLNVGIVGFGIIAFPYYFFRTRGLVQGLITTFLFFLLVMAWLFFQYCGALITYYSFQS